MLNILIRTSDREPLFRRLINDIDNQTIDKSKIRLIVSCDTDKKYPDEILAGKPYETKLIRVEKGMGQGFYNLYLNTLMEHVIDGWIYIIDDDDMIHTMDALDGLYRQLRDPNRIYLFRVLVEGIYHVPSKALFGKDSVRRGKISMSGFSIHSSKKHLVKFRQTRGGDFFFVNEMIKKLKISWLDHTVVSTGNRGLRGKMNIEKVPSIGHIYYFTPYAIDGNYGKEINHYMELLPNDDDVAVIMDGDIMFLQADFGHAIHRVLGKYPLGVFTCLTNRVGCKQQIYGGKISNNSDIKRHKLISNKLSKQHAHQATPLPPPLSGHLLVVPKKIWKEFKFKEGVGILGVDWDFTERVSKKYPLYLMRGIYVFHYYRLLEGVKNISHLK
jgi:hypothetical protein